MNKLKVGFLICALALCVCLFSGCDQVDDSIFESSADYSVDISVPYSTTTPVPDYLDVPDAVVIDVNGGVTVNDDSILDSNTDDDDTEEDEESQYETLSLGDSGTEVRNLQERLQELEYFTGDITSIFDVDTQTAVKRFEQTYGVMQTGIATPAFQVKLYDEDAPVYGSEEYDTAVTSQYTTLQLGSVGSSVYALQQRLKELGYPIDDLTGVYDEETAYAVQLFAEAYGVSNMTTAYIALQKELYSDSAITYSESTESTASDIVNYSLSLGNVGTAVMRIQNRLIELGYLEGTANGVFDSETEAAVMLFEIACGATPTGSLTTELQSLLMSDDAPEFGTAYAVEEVDYTTLQEGDEGDEVLALQERLIELGYATGSGTGIYGSETTTAVSLFQRYNGLEETGIATEETQTLMNSPTALSYQDILNGKSVSTSTEDEDDEEDEEDDDSVVDVDAETTVNPDTGYRELTIDSSGDDVLALQERLNELGYECSEDGVYDESTAEALKAFQAAIGMSQTGIATESLQQYIYTKAAPSSEYTLYNSTQDYETLEEGDTGDAVTNLQKQLWNLGYLTTEDVQDSVGTFHDKTREAVISAQLAMGYEVADGVASPEFQCFLFSDYSSYIKK